MSCLCVLSELEVWVTDFSYHKVTMYYSEYYIHFPIKKGQKKTRNGNKEKTCVVINRQTGTPIKYQ